MERYNWMWLVWWHWSPYYQQNLFTLQGDDPQHSVIPKKLGERFKTNQSKPPLVEIGGMRAKDGWIAISETGLVSCFGYWHFIKRSSLAFSGPSLAAGAWPCKKQLQWILKFESTCLYWLSFCYDLIFTQWSLLASNAEKQVPTFLYSTL